VVVFPALAVLMAAGLRYVPPLIWPGRWPRAILHTLMIAGAIAIAIGQGHFYFGPFLDRFNVEVRQHVFADAEDAMLRALELPPGTQVHLIGWDILPQSDAARFMGFMSDDYTVTVWHPGNVRIENLRLLPRNVPQAFYVLPSDTTTRIVLDAAFGELPAPQVSPNDIPPNRQFWLYLIPPDPTWQGPVGHG
jgi:hypothetical protein